MGCDVIAGLTLALTVIPQGIGYAPLAGLPLQVPFLTAILHCSLRNDLFGLLFSLFYLDLCFPFQFGLLFPFSIWIFSILFQFFLFFCSFIFLFIISRSDFGFLPIFFSLFDFKSVRACPRFWFCSGFYTCFYQGFL